jgi:23S rRNA (guanosine2251-2'-O)-methyltransferase
MGTIFEIPVLELADECFGTMTPVARMPSTNGLFDVLKYLRSIGFRCIAAHPHTDKKTVWQGDFRSDTCVLFGSEGHGIGKPLLDACDELLAIPMAERVDSLNVAAAAAVLLYEAQRQRAQ